MKVVIDTNVLISAALCAGTPRGVVLFVADHEDIEWLVTPEILKEYLEVLDREKFAFPAHVRKMWVQLIREKSRTVVSKPQAVLDRDPADVKFLDCALSGDADYLITGDKDFTVATKLGKTTILTASKFYHIVVQHLL